MRLILAAGAALVLSACGGGDSGGDADGGRTASSGDLERRFETACNEQSNMEPAICDCLAERAESDLSEGGFALLVASIEDDQDEAARLRTSLPFEETAAAGMFMVNTPAECAAANN